MATLPCGERFIRCLLGEEIDRVPYGVNLGWWPWGDTHAQWVQQSGMAELNLGAYFGFDSSMASPELHAGIFPAFERQVLAETAEHIVYRDERGITKRERRDGLSMPEFLDYPVKTADDWERLKRERLDPATPGRIPQDWEAFRVRLRQTGEGVQVGWFPFGIFGMPRELLGVEELLVSFYTQPELIEDMMRHLTDLWIALWARVADEVQIDYIHLWEDMSGKQGSLISPAMIKRFMMPCYDRIAEFARAIGARVLSVDTDGDCHELVALMTRHGVNMFFPFEVQAGNDILAYRAQYPTLGIMCGLDKRVLAGSKADVDREIERAARMLAHGRYIPGFDHLIPPDATWENYRYAAEALKALCYAQ